MIEDDLREGLRSAVTAEPPLGFSTTELVDNARRDSRRRRTALAASAAVAVVALGTVGAVAATGGLAARDDVAPAGSAQVDVMRDVGESLAEGLPAAVPAVENVSVAAEKHGGVVTFTVDDRLGAVVYEVANCTGIADLAESVPTGICPRAPGDLELSRPAAAATGPRGAQRTRVFWAVDGVVVQLRALSDGQDYLDIFGPRFCDTHHPVCKPEKRVLPGFGRLRTLVETSLYVPAASLVSPRDPADFAPPSQTYRPKHDYVREMQKQYEAGIEAQRELQRQLERERKESGGK